MSFRYLEYEASQQVPNVVVDGSPNENTVLTPTDDCPGVVHHLDDSIPARTRHLADR